MDYTSLFSERSNRFKAPAIRSLLPLELRPNMISLLAGKPNPECFPFEAITMRLKGGEEVSLQGADLNESLQYGATRGFPRLCQWLEELQMKVHKVSEPKEWAVDMGSGSQDCMHLFFSATLNDGDYVLLDAPSYPGTMGMLDEFNVNFVEVPSDDQGMMARELDEVLSAWPADRRKPKFVYTIPTGSNPSGTCASEARKMDLLRVVKKHDIMLCEDDAYFYLYFGPQPQPRSLLAMEKEVNGETGRVVRFDSFSKILSSGMRLGFFTGPRVICDRMDLIRANTVLQVASTTQGMVWSLLNHWGHDEFLEHCKRVSHFYMKQRDMFEAAAKKHLDGLATWVTPVAGMFLYLNLDLGPEGDSQDLIANKAVEAGFLAVPGTGFMPSGSKTTCVRTSFSLSYPEQADEAFRRLAAVLKSHGEA